MTGKRGGTPQPSSSSRTSARAAAQVRGLSLAFASLVMACGNPTQDAETQATTSTTDGDSGIGPIELPPQVKAADVLGEAAPDDAVIVSLSFDDGFASQARFFELLDEYQLDSLKATFYVNSSRLNLELNERESRDHHRFAPLELWLEAARQGHEIGSHTVSHLDLSCDHARAEANQCQNGHVAIDDDERRRQVCADRQMLISLGFDVTGFAYPFGRHEVSANGHALHDIVARCGFDYARRVSGLKRGTDEDGDLPVAETFPPENHLSIRSYTSLTEDVTFEDLRGWILDAIDSGGGWVPLILHHVSPDCRDPENPDEQLGVCTLEAELGKLLQWLGRVNSDDAAPDQVFVRTIGQVMAEVGPSNVSLVANGDLEDEHSGSIERPNCFDRFQGRHETNFEWVDAETESDTTSEFRGANGRFEKMLPSDSHPSPLLQMTTRDDRCYAAVSPSLSYQARVRARAERSEAVGMRFIFRVLEIDTSDAGAEPLWSDWEVNSSTFELTESWSTYTQNVPPLDAGVVALAFGVQYVSLTDDDAGELWVDDFELREFRTPN